MTPPRPVASAALRSPSPWTDSLIGRFLSALFFAYEEGTVRYAVLRNHERWPQDFGKDIDLVIHANDVQLSHRIIRRLAPAFGLTWTVRRKRSSHYTYYLLPADGGTEPGILLDLRTDVVHHGFVYLPGQYVLGWRRRYDRFYIPAPAVESLAILLHCVIDAEQVRDSYRERLRVLRTGGTGDLFLQVASSVVGEALARRLEECVRAGAPAAALPLRRQLLRAVALRNPQAISRWFKGRRGAAWDRLRAWFRPTGQLVILMGPDGSGKTTLSERLCQHFAPTRIPASSVYLGAQKPLLPTRRLSQKIRQRITPAGTKKPIKDVNRRQRLRGLAHLMADKWLRYLVQVRPRLVRGEVVVLDRYFYDLLTFAHPWVRFPWVGALIMRLIPKPELAFCLQADPALIAARKHELTVAETARQIEIYRGLKRWVADFHEVPADGHLPAVVDSMAQHVVRVYAAARAPETV